MEVKVLKIINQNNNWRDILSAEPYNLIIKEKNNFVLLKYDQLNSDMSNEIVQECRGIILRNINNKYEIASMRFTKFFNYGQEQAAKLEFPCEASQKIDGSLIGVWYDKMTGWHVSTSGNIDAEDAPINISNINNYRELFNIAWGDLELNILDKKNTYMFELVSPYTRIIVPYNETKLYLLAIRNNETLKEISRNELSIIAKQLFGDKIEVPKSFLCNNIEEVQNAVNKLTEDNEHYEGFVLCDKYFNRVKMKSSTYMDLFFIKGEGIFSDKKILQLILDEQDDDILGHFPEYTDDFNRIRHGLCLFIAHLKKDLHDISKYQNLDRKGYAQKVQEYKYKDILFKAYGCNLWNKDEDYYYNFLKTYIETIPISKLVDWVVEETNE
ncbi:MAG: hypothetical protein IJH63_11230 [Methanobrevibacter sp.]|nr:hypothetical protein [Methanobrevibacter sp.]